MDGFPLVKYPAFFVQKRPAGKLCFSTTSQDPMIASVHDRVPQRAIKE
jgi:hypothetical protein